MNIRRAVAILAVCAINPACSAPAPQSEPEPAAAAAPVAAAVPAVPRVLEDPEGWTLAAGDQLLPTLPPEILEFVPHHVIRFKARWTPGQVVRVCFIGGDRSLRERIRDAALQWTAHGNLRLDFGPSPELRACDSARPTEIRIGFEYRGYWSVVGDTSALAPSVQTMNLAAFHTAPPQEPRFTGVVLHEFGHALGFEHEHQHPDGGCDTEFNWPVVYAELAKPPNGWSREKTDLNLRSFTDRLAYGLSSPDRTSIMHYSLDPWMFVSGEASKCYVREQTSLSELDRRGVASAYPANATLQLGAQKTQVQQLLEALPPDAGAARLYLQDVAKVVDIRARGLSKQ